VVLEIFEEYSDRNKPNDFLSTGALSALIPILFDPDSDNCSIATRFLYSLALQHNEVSNILFSDCHCLSQMILNYEYVKPVVILMFLSKAPISRVSKAFSDIFSHKSKHQTHLKVSSLIQLISRSNNFKRIVLQTIINSNLLKFTLEELYTSLGEIDSTEKSFEIISSYGFCCSTQRIIPDPNVLQFFIPCLKRNPYIWEGLLPCLADIIKTIPELYSTVPLDLVPLLLSLETSEELCKYVLEIANRALTLHDQKFLQHLVDNGLLTFLSSSLKLKHLMVKDDKPGKAADQAT
jgi:hypothetical protein